MQCPRCDTINSLIWTNNVSKGGKVYCTNTSCDTKRPLTPIQLTKLARMTKIWLARIDSTSSSSLDSATTPTNPTATPQPQDLEASIQHHVAVDMPQQPAIAPFEHHPTVPQIATDVLAQLSSLQQQLVQQQHKQDRQHQTQLQFAATLNELSALKTLLAEKDDLIDRQQKELEELRNKVTTPAVIPDLLDSLPAPQGVWNDTNRVHRLHQGLAQVPSSRALRQQQAARRHFMPPSTNQGFQYVYIPIRARLRIGQVRQQLKALKIDNSRIIDVHYPAMNTTVPLVHNDFANELTAQLAKAGINPLESFDPQDHKHLNDPKYNDQSEQERTIIATTLHRQRMARSLKFIREPVKFAVAKSFAAAGWITSDQLDAILQHSAGVRPQHVFTSATLDTQNTMDEE